MAALPAALCFYTAGPCFFGFYCSEAHRSAVRAGMSFWKKKAADAKPWDTRVSYLPEPIVCWSCGHYLGDDCRECARGGCYVAEHRAPAFRNRPRKCNGHAFPGSSPCRRPGGDENQRDKQDREPLKEHYSLLNGAVVYTHVLDGDQRVHVPVNRACAVCGALHQA